MPFISEREGKLVRPFAFCAEHGEDLTRSTLFKLQSPHDEDADIPFLNPRYVQENHQPESPS